MPVNTPCDAYNEHAKAWEIIEDAIDGELAIKEAGEAYLAKLYKEEAESYAARLQRASFYNGTARTYSAWLGLITRKPPAITTPGDMDAFLADATLAGQPFASYCDTVVADLVKYGRAGTLIDWSEDDSRPYLTHYDADDIINWSTQSIRGKRTLSLLVLEEHSTETFAIAGEPLSEDEFAPQRYPQWRVYDLQPNGEALGVRMRLFRESQDKPGEFVVIAERYPEKRGQKLERIPFVFHSTDQSDRFNVCPPPLLDIALLNLAHYRSSADLRNGLHVAGTPTPWAAGFTDSDDSELLLGCSSAWISSDPQARCGFLEFTGAGLKAIADDMAAVESQMAALGARAMLPQKAEAEAFQTVALRSSSETANLSAIAASASRSLTEVLQWAAFWNATAAVDAPEKVTEAVVAYNTDLNTGGANPAMITALVQAFQTGVVSWETLFHNFDRAELYPEGHTLEDEQTAIEQAKIAPPAAPPANQPPA